MKLKVDARARALQLCSVAAIALLPTYAFALEQGGPDVREREPQVGVEFETVMVTARRVSENIQEVPISVTALTGAALEEKNVSDVLSLANLVPGMNITSYVSPTTLIFGLRGQRNSTPQLGQDAAVAYYVADVPYGFQKGLNQALFDLADVQILKGPQGTLFGRNTTGGAILVNPARPTDAFEGYVSGGVESFERGANQFGEAVLNLPVSPQFALRFGVNAAVDEGYIRNGAPESLRPFFQQSPAPGPQASLEDIGERRSYAWRASALWTPTPDIENYFLYQGSYERGDGVAPVLLGINPTGFAGALYNGVSRPSIQDVLTRVQAAQADYFWSTETGIDGYDDLDSTAFTNTTSIQFGDLTLKNIFGYHWVRSHQYQDYGGTPFQGIVVRPHEKSEEFSNELQLLGTSFNENLDWVIGAFYYEQRAERDNYTWALGALNSHNGGEADNKSSSLFAQGTLHIGALPGLSIIAGVRNTWDERGLSTFNFNGAGLCNIRNAAGARFPVDACSLSDSADFESETYTFGLSYEPDDRTLIYATTRSGYRSGGFNVLAQSSGAFQPYDPEEVTDYEIGLKKDWRIGDAALRTNIAVYHSDYENIQRRVLDPNTVGEQTIINAASATIDGAEFEFAFLPTPDLEISGSYSYVDASYEDFLTGGGDFTDYTFSFVPERSWTIAIRYTLFDAPSLGILTVGGDYSWEDMVYYDDTAQGASYGPFDIYTRDSYEDLSLRADWESFLGSAVDIALFVKNATNERVLPFGVSTYSTLGLQGAFFNKPRRIGIEARYSF